MTKKKYLPIGYKPTKEEANKFIDHPYSANPNVGNEKDEALNKLFQECIPENKNFEAILAKCITLNVLANTNIIEVFYIAKHISELNIDDRLKREDYKLINDISEVDINGKTHHFYSFASKYCCFHNPNMYSIYDRYVDIVLWELQEQDHFSNFKRCDLKKYKCYMKVLEDFRNYYGFPENEFSKKDLDKYLWLFGKECVNKKDNNE